MRVWTFTEYIRRILARFGGAFLVLLYWKVTKNKSSRTRAIILNADKSKILLVKNITVKDFHLPGGGIDGQETPETAVIREVKEELGINTTILYKLGRYLYQGTNKYVDIFVTQTESEEFFMQWELDAAEWFSIKSLPILRKTTKQAIRDFLAQNQPTTGVWGLDD